MCPWIANHPNRMIKNATDIRLNAELFSYISVIILNSLIQKFFRYILVVCRLWKVNYNFGAMSWNPVLNFNGFLGKMRRHLFIKTLWTR